MFTATGVNDIEDIVKWNGLNDTKLKVGERLKIKR
jgi:membrane-bound lytic murein transglycosylase D